MSQINSSSQKQSSTQPTSQRQSRSSPLRGPDIPSQYPDTPSEYTQQALNLLKMDNVSPLTLPSAQVLDTSHHSAASMSSNSSTELESNELELTELIKDGHEKHLSLKRDDIEHSQEMIKNLTDVYDNITKKEGVKKSSSLYET